MRFVTFPFIAAASPAFAADGPFVSLANTDFIVLLSFLLFIGVLVYLKVPGLLGRMLDKRADTIRGELDEAKRLREEAQTILASYERKAREVETQAQAIVDRAKAEAEDAAESAKAALQASIARRLAAAEDQIASAEASAVREVRDRAIEVAVSAAAELMSNSLSPADADQLIENSIAEVKERLH